ncbi:hypothetical protein K7X08_006747 [Anisodus acutangulus]|uniref:Uncharacterized protein n=1 Tax=Anisodus acutangulus TaxID=402998 RepID=A0A9Q1MZF8_9SOLA|nr:hypothetical protein K7X08_006747 [Anisodus acutangulus]
MHKNSFLSEAIMEEVIYEDLPLNLCAIRDYIEKRETEKPLEKFNHDAFREASRDIEVLKAELLAFISEHGNEGFMPMRKQLRKHGRVDIEKAITRMGGFRRIASLMNLSLAYKHRKPKGYWDSLENLQEELGNESATSQISRLQKNWGMDPSYMPSRKSFERAGSSWILGNGLASQLDIGIIPQSGRVEREKGKLRSVRFPHEKDFGQVESFQPFA